MTKKKFKAIELNCLDEDTIQNIRNWRNQEFVRRNSFHQDIISEEEHSQWIQRVKADEYRNVFVFYLDDVPFGVVQYTYDTENQWVKEGAYLVSEEYSLVGYGPIMSFFSQDIAYNVLGYDTRYCEIFESNKNGQAVMRFLGAKAEARKERAVSNGKTVNVLIVRGVKQDWNDFVKEKLGKLVLKFVYEDYVVIKN